MRNVQRIRLRQLQRAAIGSAAVSQHSARNTFLLMNANETVTSIRRGHEKHAADPISERQLLFDLDEKRAADPTTFKSG